MIRKPNFKLNWKYALGEVLLIFIGITSAITFQNWNEQRKVNRFEREILSEIDESLLLDSLELRQIRDNFLLADLAAEKVLTSQNNVTDSISIWLGQFISFDRFNPSSSPYEVLKSAGLQTISDKSLRSFLAEYYDDTVPNIIQALQDVEEDFENNAVNFFRDKFEDFRFKEFARPKDIESFMKDPANIIYFKIFRDNRAGALDDLQNGLKLNHSARALIKDELSK